MAIQTGNATSNGSFSNISISGNGTKTGNITWDAPSLPSNATITSTTLTASLKINMILSTASVTINGTSYKSSSELNINLGTTMQTSLSVTCKGDKRYSYGTVSISNIVYTITYQYDAEAVETVKQIYIGDINISNIKMGNSSITKVYIGDSLIWKV